MSAAPWGRRGPARRYRIEKQLGEGSGARVYLATWLPDSGSADETRPVALKIATDAKWKKRLQDEGQLLRKLGEAAEQDLAPDRIVRVLQDGQLFQIEGRTGPDPLIELEYLDGQTLHEWMKDWFDKQVESAEVVEKFVAFGLDLCDALKQLAAVDPPIIHRDLKPDNIMVTRRGLRVFDLNVGGSLDVQRRTRVGTAGYMAPEVEAGGEQDERADFYSVGVILFEIVFRRRFNPGEDLTGAPSRYTEASDSGVFEDADAPVRASIHRLLARLLCQSEERVRSADELAEMLLATLGEQESSAQPRGPLGDLDMISVLFELRPSGVASVVADTRGQGVDEGREAILRERMLVADPLEDWLLAKIEALATGERQRPALVVLAGNAGDGKSHLIERLLTRMAAEQPPLLDRVEYISDATHAHSPDEDQRERLRRFFEPFADGATDDGRVRIVAMNTGMVINFFEPEQRLSALYQALSWRLGLRRTPPEKAPGDIEVVNLDLRNLLSPRRDASSFADAMLDKLDPRQSDSLPADHWGACKACPAFRLCPVAFNLSMLGRPEPRSALVRLLERASLNAEVHLSPRNMWGFFYRALTGGTERYVEGRVRNESPCDYVRRKVANNDGRWLLEGQMTESLFGQAGGGPLFEALIQHDPAYSASPAIDRLHTMLSVRSELDRDPEYLSMTLGGEAGFLETLDVARLASILPPGRAIRRNAAVRRQFFFDNDTLQAWQRMEGSDSFVGLLAAYSAWSRGLDLSAKEKASLSRLVERVRAVFQRAHGRRFGEKVFMRVGQPNVRSTSELLVQATQESLRSVFSLRDILCRDPQAVAHDDRRDLLDTLGYRPFTVVLSLAGVQLLVDLDLYTFLARVEEGQKPSQRDLAQFQALLFVGERIGSALAQRDDRRRPLYVYSADENTLHCLEADEFGEVRMADSELPGGVW